MNHKTVLRQLPVLLALLLLSAGCSHKKEERSLADLLRALKANDEAVRIMAAEEHREQGLARPAQACPRLRAAPQGPRANSPRGAVKALAPIRPASPPTTPRRE